MPAQTRVTLTHDDCDAVTGFHQTFGNVGHIYCGSADHRRVERCQKDDVHTNAFRVGLDEVVDRSSFGAVG